MFLEAFQEGFAEVVLWLEVQFCTYVCALACDVALCLAECGADFRLFLALQDEPAYFRFRCAELREGFGYCGELGVLFHEVVVDGGEKPLPALVVHYAEQAYCQAPAAF